MAIVVHLAVDPHGSEPSYVQLAGQLREAIASGEIGPREPLPSISYIAQETGLSPNTIRHAVSLLVDENVAYTIPGRGTFAAPRT